MKLNENVKKNERAPLYLFAYIQTVLVTSSGIKKHDYIDRSMFHIALTKDT